jgi:hypothetical protein
LLPLTLPSIEPSSTADACNANGRAAYKAAAAVPSMNVRRSIDDLREMVPT